MNFLFFLFSILLISDYVFAVTKNETKKLIDSSLELGASKNKEELIRSSAKILTNFEVAIKNFSKLHKGPILIAHSDINVTGHAVKTAKNNFDGVLGVYPNRGYYEKCRISIK